MMSGAVFSTPFHTNTGQTHQALAALTGRSSQRLRLRAGARSPGEGRHSLPAAGSGPQVCAALWSLPCHCCYGNAVTEHIWNSWAYSNPFIYGGKPRPGDRMQSPGSGVQSCSWTRLLGPCSLPPAYWDLGQPRWALLLRWRGLQPAQARRVAVKDLCKHVCMVVMVSEEGKKPTTKEEICKNLKMYFFRDHLSPLGKQCS